MTTLFDGFVGKKLADDATARGWENAGEPWRQQALEDLESLCRRHADFTADDLDDVAKLLEDPRAIGGLVREGLKRGWCAPTGEYRISKIARCHQRPKRVWRSLIVEASK